MISMWNWFDAIHPWMWFRACRHFGGQVAPHTLLLYSELFAKLFISIVQCSHVQFQNWYPPPHLLCFQGIFFAAPLFIAFKDLKCYLYVHTANTKKSPDHKYAVITLLLHWSTATTIWNPLKFFDGFVKETAVTCLELIFSIVSERDGKTLLKM